MSASGKIAGAPMPLEALKAQAVDKQTIAEQRGDASRAVTELKAQFWLNDDTKQFQEDNRDGDATLGLGAVPESHLTKKNKPWMKVLGPFSEDQYNDFVKKEAFGGKNRIDYSLL